MVQVPFRNYLHGGRLNFSDWLLPLAFLFRDTLLPRGFEDCGSEVVRLSVSTCFEFRFSAEAIFASSTSKSGIRIPLTEHEDLRSSTDSTISTSLIHSIASVRHCEQVHTSVLKLIFQQANVADVGEFVKMKIWNLQSLLVCSIIL